MSGFTDPPPAPPSQVASGPPGTYPPQPPIGPPLAYPSQVVYHHHTEAGRTSGLAIASMVLGILWIFYLGSILAVIFGHIAISQTSKNPNLRGRGMAIAGLVLGYIGIGLLALTIFAASGGVST